LYKTFAQGNVKNKSKAVSKIKGKMYWIIQQSKLAVPYH